MVLKESISQSSQDDHLRDGSAGPPPHHSDHILSEPFISTFPPNGREFIRQTAAGRTRQRFSAALFRATPLPWCLGYGSVNRIPLPETSRLFPHQSCRAAAYFGSRNLLEMLGFARRKVQAKGIRIISEGVIFTLNPLRGVGFLAPQRRPRYEPRRWSLRRRSPECNKMLSRCYYGSL